MGRIRASWFELPLAVLVAVLVWLGFRQGRLEFVESRFFGFVCLTFFVYWLMPWQRGRLLWILAVSIAFYMTWHPLLILLIGASAVADFWLGILIEQARSPRLKRGLLIGSIAMSLALLAWFKYTNFLLDSSNSLLALVGIDYHWPLFDNLLLPLGISFYTFETISYVVDVYRGRCKAVRNLADYALFLTFFPHLAAGPIVRPRDFLPQLQRRKRFRWYRLTVGVNILLVGLFKKAVIADHLAAVVDPVFADPAAYASRAIWLASVGYALQIYCDFSGYSDMAMGLAHMLGFKLPLNFALPYLAANITEFWRRWHLSLSSWLRDYLYIPLGGSRHGRWATYRNLMVTMLLGGLWHGAGWTFVFWGFYHGLLLSLHRFWTELRPERESAPPSGLRWALAVAATFLSVSLGWVFFRAQTFSAASIMTARLVLPTDGAQLAPLATLLVAVSLALVLAGHLFGTFWSWRRIEQRLPAPVVGAVTAVLVMLFLTLMPESSKGFIYFRF